MRLKWAFRPASTTFPEEWAMTSFESIHQEEILGSLTMFDRMIFKGHLTGLFPRGAFARFLSVQGVLLKDFGPFVEGATGQIQMHLRSMAAEERRPFQYLESGSKEEEARRIAERDGVKEGLVCILRALEPCWSFEVRGNRQTQKLEVVRRERKCLHYYLYYIDPEFGWMHVRLQSWFPFTIQIYINGREWLSRQLETLGIPYSRYDNSLLQIADLAMAQSLCRKFEHRCFARVWDHFARRVNPWLRTIQQLGFGSYYWVVDQCEIATDTMFRDRETLAALMPDLLRQASLYFSAEDVLRFLGRKLHGNFQGEVLTDRKKRAEGVRIKHSVKRNSVKMYDKWSVLRVETTINNPREFKVLRASKTASGEISRRWVPMGKGVANLWRYAQVGKQANARYLEGLAQAENKGKVVAELDELCQSRTVNGKRFARFQPVGIGEARVFQAVMDGQHLLNGFRNQDLAHLLEPLSEATDEQKRRRCARISRLIAKLRGHGLIAKVPGSRLYRTTQRGYRTMAAVLRFRGIEFPTVYRQALPA